MSDQSPYEIIDQQRALVADLASKLAQAQAQLAGMEKIFGALPTRRRSPSATQGSLPRKAEVKPSGPAGRQPGAISMRWRTILNALHRDGKPFKPLRVTEVVKEIEDRIMKPSEAKRILEGYIEYGYVRKAGWDAFEVTEDAAERFNFKGSNEFDIVINALEGPVPGADGRPALGPAPPESSATSALGGWRLQAHPPDPGDEV